VNLRARAEIESIRNRFPVFKNKIYLNSCSQGALSDSVEEALLEHIRTWHDDGSPWDRWVEQYEAARASFANFIGAKPDEVAIVSCASAGISAIASALDFGGGRRKVVMGEFEFPTMGQIWLAQQVRGAEIQFIASQDGRIPASEYGKAIDETTLIVPVTGVCFMNGARSDVQAVATLARERGALVMLDDYQDCGTRPIDVKALRFDFYVFALPFWNRVHVRSIGTDSLAHAHDYGLVRAAESVCVRREAFRSGFVGAPFRSGIASGSPCFRNSGGTQPAW
jgi:selenocysteine lyase/cysteine desulfurase